MLIFFYLLPFSIQFVIAPRVDGRAPSIIGIISSNTFIAVTNRSPSRPKSSRKRIKTIVHNSEAMHIHHRPHSITKKWSITNWFMMDHGWIHDYRPCNVHHDPSSRIPDFEIRKCSPSITYYPVLIIHHASLTVPPSSSVIHHSSFIIPRPSSIIQLPSAMTYHSFMLYQPPINNHLPLMISER